VVNLRKGKVLFSSESVTCGHPDKICDMVSDAILDECLKQDPDSRVAVETATKTGSIINMGELTTKAYVDIPKVVRETLKYIGYTKNSYGIEWETCAVMTQIEEQSPDISQGVTQGSGLFKEQGAGDQGMMFGYAVNETEELMPLPISLAHKLTNKLREVRLNGKIPYFGPDGKSQVTIEYIDGKPIRIDAVVISNQHDKGIEHQRIEKDVIEFVINPICKDLMDDKTKVYVNPTGNFVRGGPFGDAGLTGRKIIVDTYGGRGRHGGGAFSGKDPSKVDRSAAYAARYIAKNIVKAGLADECEVQLAYAIGVAEPVSIYVDCFETEKIPSEKISEIVKEVFPTKPADIIKHLGLKNPIYRKTAQNGHFGNPDFPWEKTDKVEILKNKAGI
jgi:S-adenosylmethionine synthetase